MASRTGRDPQPAPPHADPGLQPERTVMSWGRTGLATSVVALLMIRWYPSVGSFVFVPVLVAVLGAGLIQLSQRRRYQAQASGIAQERVGADFWAVCWMTVMAVFIAGTAILAMWTV